MKKHKCALHVFRRDLRLEDNTALTYALETSDKVIPCFILDKRQVKENKYRSNNALQFMLNSLQELDNQLRKRKGRLYLFYDIAEEVIERLLSSLKIDLVTINRDYTPFSKKRDAKIQSMLEQKNVEYSCHADTLLNEPEAIHKDDFKPYTIFTPFLRKAKTFQVREPLENNHTHYYSLKIKNQEHEKIWNQILPQKNPNILLEGGRKEGLKRIEHLSSLSDYEKQRDYPSKDSTSHLSAHIKFGTVSIREAYHQIKTMFGDSHPLITELYWRDFFTHITYHFPQVIGNAFHRKYEKIKWVDNKDLFRAWCEGKTGYPMVDAGIRELNATGYMHNRARMITASFLVKDLHIDWRWGERYFAQNLIDYDPAVNNGNWQWAASTGCDAQPYFRIFNPWRQQKKFDPDCDYIKKWIPELKDLSPKEIHNLEKQRPAKESLYPKPIVDHKEASSTAKAMYSFVAKKSEKNTH